MELVRGIPITEYCDQHQLDPRQRLELFVTVCRAVQHAHQKGIIHRDLKPSNVLVEQHDVTPVPKIIDFGVAKAINRELTEKTLFTNFAQLIGTPLYMSPEQAELSGLDVDTRSDIYSLGVLLYELLTGTTPFDRERLHSAPYDELRRIIREEEPPLPSTRLSTLAADLATTVTDRRRTDTRRLMQTIRGDLDWIVMKCLEKDRNRRYESASGLAEDIERYLADEQVLARPPSRLDRATKWARRHRPLVASAIVSTTAMLAMSFIALATSNILISRERNEKAAALQDRTVALERAERNFQTVLSVIDRLFNRVGNEKLADVPQLDQLRKEVFDDALEFYEKLLVENPDDSEVKFATARARISVVKMKTVMDARGQAIPPCEQAIVALDQLLLNDPSNASYRYELGTALIQKHYCDAATLREDARAVELFQGLADESPDESTYINSLVQALFNQWSSCVELDTAEGIVNRMLQLTASRQLETHYAALVQETLAKTNDRAGRLDEAEAAYRESIRTYDLGLEERPKPGGGHEHQITTCTNFGKLLSRRGKMDEAEQIFRQAIRFGEQASAEFPAMEFFQRLSNEARIALIEFLRSQGRSEEAVEVAAKMPAHDAADYYRRAKVNDMLGQSERAVEDRNKAIELFSKEIARNPQATELFNNRGCVYLELSQKDKAIEDFCDAIELSPGIHGYWSNRAEAYVRLGQYDNALRDANKAIELGPASEHSWHTRAGIHFLLRQFDKAAVDISQAISLAPNDPVLRHHRTEAYLRLGQYEQAMADANKLVELQPSSSTSWNTRAYVYFRMKQFEKSLIDFSKAIDIDPNNLKSLSGRRKAHMQLGNTVEAEKDYQQAITAEPTDRKTLNSLAWRLATAQDDMSRDGKLAVALSTKTCELTEYRNAGLIDTLAAAYAETADFDSAVTWSKRAIELAANNAERLEFTKHLDKFQVRVPWRED
jgi:tetratricopeptide (TPR) repeat protein